MLQNKVQKFFQKQRAFLVQVKKEFIESWNYIGRCN